MFLVREEGPASMGLGPLLPPDMMGNKMSVTRSRRAGPMRQRFFSQYFDGFPSVEYPFNDVQVDHDGLTGITISNICPLNGDVMQP